MAKLNTIVITTLVAFAGFVAAHGHSTQIDLPHTFVTEDGTYYILDEDQEITFWKETNGVLTGGEYDYLHGRTGLQTEAFCLLENGRNAPLNAEGGCTSGTYTEADTFLTPEEFASEIAEGATHEILP